MNATKFGIRTGSAVAISDWESYEIVCADGKAAADVKRDLRQRAVEIFEDEIEFALFENRRIIAIPVFAAKVILICAKDGARKGQGRGRGKGVERQRAVEMFRKQIAGAMNEGEITLSLAAAKVILACAWDGARKGQGRHGRPPDAQRTKLRKHTALKLAVQWARGRKAELVGGGMKATGAGSAEDQAAKEASALLAGNGDPKLAELAGLAIFHGRSSRHARMNLADTTLKRLMQSPPRRTRRRRA
jgi:hypothetical protein